jgi:hypothetical protein
VVYPIFNSFIIIVILWNNYQVVSAFNFEARIETSEFNTSTLLTTRGAVSNQIRREIFK